MKTKMLLIYGYVLPYAASIVGSALPTVIPFLSYAQIFKFYQDNLASLTVIFAAALAITLPFQSKIIHEDDSHVLAVLRKGSIRNVFVKATVFQNISILFFLSVVVVFSYADGKIHESKIGFIQLFATCVIMFESYAIIKNGLEYGKIREKIIERTSKALLNRR